MKLSKTYEPNQYEPDIYAMWEKSGAFEPSGKGEPFSIVMPPPNANANLHLGHALMAAVEDIMVRYHRMKGDNTIYIPGADHAGFETWVVYERHLAEEGKSRFDFPREALYQQVWDFVHENRGNMELQLRALGASCSWHDLVFTLDKKVIDTVYKTFKKMWDDGLVYRGERIVNYSTKYQTAYADIEVDHKVEKGTLYQISYPYADQNGEIIIATTRPETIFADTAVAVNPNDKRYKDVIGKSVIVPLTDHKIPVIADEHADPEFGSGAVKITPAHDPNDFEVGKRHNLDRPQVIDYEGNMTNVPDEFMGMDVATARKKVVEKLENEGFLRGKSTIEHTVGYDYKSGLPIEPMIMKQWFIDVKPLTKKAIDTIRKGEITFTPASRKNALIQYYENLHDWNISRQIPWGIPIPAFQNVDNPDDWIFNTRVDQETIEVDGKKYKRDEDTFDTWFSSGQWPYITTDYLTNGKLSKYYPTSVMETGADILYAWVARMIMLGLYVTDQIPFKHVYLHGLVLDEKGQKMSKSKFNVINPMESVSEYGSDALRLGITANRSAGQNQAFSIGKVVTGRNFCNKLWNIARFIEGKLGEDYKPFGPQPKTPADHWIAERLDNAVKTVAKQIETYRFAEASETIYHAVWDDVADWYIEASKADDNLDMLAWVLDTILAITHPFAPFVTETIWQTLSWHTDMLITSKWPEKIDYTKSSASEFSKLKYLVTEARYVMSELPGNNRYEMLYQSDELVANNIDLIQKLAKLKGIQKVDHPKGLRLAVSGREAWLDIPAETIKEHESNLEARLAETRNEIKVLEGRLDNESYIKKAPKKLVEETREVLEQKKTLVDRLVKELDVLS